jgi:hypothetical protein
MAGPAGLFPGAVGLAQSGSNMSARERLLFGGLLLAGGAATGKAAYSKWRAEATQRLAAALPEQRAAQAAAELRNVFPGRSERSYGILAQEDNAGLARALSRFESQNNLPDERLAGMAARMDGVAATDTLPSFLWGEFDDLAEQGWLPRDIQQTYDDFRDGLFVPDEEWERLSTYVVETLDDQAEVGLTGRLTNVYDNSGNPLPVYSYDTPKPGNVYLDDAYRATRVAQLNMKPQFDQAVRNIEDLYRAAKREGVAEHIPASDAEAQSMYWGLDLGIAGSPYIDERVVIMDHAFRQAYENLKPEFGEHNLAGFHVRDLAGAMWRKRKSEHFDNPRGDWFGGNPYRLKPNGEENPAFLALIGAGNELPASLSGVTSESMPLAAIENPAGAGLSVFADEYDVTHAAETTRQMDAAMRHMFPGPLGDKDSIPRWLPGRPLQLKSFETLDAGVLSNPTAVVETMHSGSYPGFQPGEYIMFDSTGKMPPWAKDHAGRLPGGAARERPARAPRKLGLADMKDGDTARRALAENQWSVYVNPSKDLMAELRAGGYQPIPLRGGHAPAVLVLGEVRPHGGVEHYMSHMDLPLGTEAEWVLPTRSGERVEVTRPEAAGIPGERTTDRVARFVYKVDQREAHQIARLAADLENTGNTNVVLYTRQPRLDGWEAAREHVYRGPDATVKVVRTADPMIGESHSVPVLIREGSGLPTRPVDIDKNEVNLNGIRTVADDGLVIDVENEADLFNAFRDAAEVGTVHGHGNVTVRHAGKRIMMAKPDKYAPYVESSDWVNAAPIKTRPPAADDPNVNGVRIIQRYGAGDSKRMSPELAADISGALDQFMIYHSEVAELWGLSWVSVGKEMHGKIPTSAGGGGYVAASNMGAPGSGIHLNEDRWADEAKIRNEIAFSNEHNYMAGRGVQGVILHELGHIMAGLVRQLEDGKAGRISKGGSALHDELAPKFAKWAQEGGLSGRGVLDLDEAIAESVADVLSNNFVPLVARGYASSTPQGFPRTPPTQLKPGKFAASLEIYETVVRHLKQSMPAKQKFWGAVDQVDTAAEKFAPPQPGSPYVRVVKGAEFDDELDSLEDFSNDVTNEHVRRIQEQIDPYGRFESQERYQRPMTDAEDERMSQYGEYPEEEGYDFLEFDGDSGEPIFTRPAQSGPDMRLGMSTYLSHGSGPMNDAARGTKRSRNYRGEDYSAEIAGMEHAFTLGEPMPANLHTVYRGVRRTGNDSKRFFASSLVPGTEFVDHGFVSVAHNPEWAIRFSNFDGSANERTIFRISIADEARDVNVLAGIEREDEWVLPRHSKFRVGPVVEYRQGPQMTQRIIDLEWLGVAE